MNVKRFTARTSRDALALVRQSLGERSEERRVGKECW